MAKKNDTGPSLLPAIPGMDLLPDQTAVAEAAPQAGGSGLAFLKLDKAGRYSVFDEDMGTEILVVIGPWRSRACLWEGGAITKESFDEKSPAYDEIKRFKKVKGSNDGPCVGPEFLLWLVGKKQFALYHAKNTAAKQAPAAVALQGRIARMGSSKNTNKGNTWYTPTFAASVETPDPKSLPTPEQYQQAVEAFLAPLRETEGKPAGARPR